MSPSNDVQFRLSRIGLILGSALLAATSCSSAHPTDSWTHSQAFVIAVIRNDVGGPLPNAAVRALVANGQCPAGETATVSETTSNPAGRAAFVVKSLPVSSFDGCVRLEVSAASYRDTTTSGYDITFRAPNAAKTDTLNVTIALGHS